MSAEAVIALGVGLGILALAFVGILLWDGRTPATEGIADDTQLQIWTERAAKANEDFGLAHTRGAGEKWAGTIAALLGVLSTVAFVAGPSSLADDVGGTEAIVAGGLILVAAALAAIATLLAALAEHGTPIEVDDLNGPTYRTLLRTRARRAAKQIRWSRTLTVGALLLIVAATGTAWAAALTGPDDPSQSAIVVSSTGAECGTLLGTNGTLHLEVTTGPKPVPADATITLVGSCPK